MGARQNPELSLKFLDSLQNDLKNLSIETKKKFPQIKEACEEGILKLRNVSSNPQSQMHMVVNQILYPVVQGCETKDQKIIKMCISMMQRLITNQAIDQKGARYITDTLWMLMESGTEEVKILQSCTLLLTTNSVVHGEILAKNLVLCFRLHFAKDSTTINTAGATVRHLVSHVFERVLLEDDQFREEDHKPRNINYEELKTPSNIPPKGIRPCAGDAYLMFQDLVQLVNTDQPYWLIGMTEMTRTFGLELLESILINYPSVFYKHPEFSFLLKERVCALVIKLFSPNIKYRNNALSSSGSSQQNAPLDKPYFPISVRLLRVVSILVQKYHVLLVTECEIFLSLIIKFLDPDKPVWQRSLALEVLHKLCVQTELLKAFCQSYDLKDHTTHIFQDIVNSLATYVHSVFLNSSPSLSSSSVAGGQAAQGQPPAMLVGLPVGPGVSPQPGFFYRGVWLPIVITCPPGQVKSTYLEMMDKVEAPSIPDGYGISIAYACLLEIIRSISLVIAGSNTRDENLTVTPEQKQLHVQMINSSWCGVLAALSPLIDSSTDEAVTENILKSMQTFTSLCGGLELSTPRDAFITAICKASLPAHYTLTVLNTNPPLFRAQNGGLGDIGANQYYANDWDYKHQVVVVGTPLPTSSLPSGAHHGPVMLTAKNLQSMRAILSLAHCHGSILGASWHLVLTTLQHLVWILGLKPSTGGSLQAGKTNADTNAVLTTAVMADLPVLSAMLSRLFESSQYLSDVALHHLIDALCKLSQEAMELAYCNREPSLFAVAKLLETGLVNLPRVEVLWKPLTNHLLEVCQHPHIRMREWGVEAITYLVKAALHYKYQPPLRENQKLQELLLGPLSELSSVPHGDVRQRQLECVLQVLHGSGETLSHGWPLVLSVIGAVNDQHGENLIRIAFQCLQLVVTDFLPLMPWKCLPLCLETTSKFGSQTQELNISLTAIGLMWYIADYFYQNQEKICVILANENSVFPEINFGSEMPAFDKLWMCLYLKLGALCVDLRPAVRKSAGQTLLSTISSHGNLLAQSTWQAVLWQVLFPLLDKVRSLSSTASSKKVDTEGNILIHHSRNTAQKQWAETQVLTLSGVARVFNTKRQLLQTLGDFPRAWSLLLEFIENSALSKNNEVSLAALRSLQEMLILNENVSSPQNTKTDPNEDDIWTKAWKVWLKIATECHLDPEYCPSQQFLASLVLIFPGVFQHISSRFVLSDLEKLCSVIEIIISIPLCTKHFNPNATSASTFPDSALIQLQDGILECIFLLEKEARSSPAKLDMMICPIFKELLHLSQFAYQKVPHHENKQVQLNDYLSSNYVQFGEKAIAELVSLYKKTAKEKPVVEGQILTKILESFNQSLSRRYDPSYQGTWKLTVQSFLSVVQTGVPLARCGGEHTGPMWTQLALMLDNLLFPKSAPSAEMTPDEMLEDETVDCHIVQFLKDEILSYSNQIPKEFILKVVILLNKGSILSSSYTSLIANESNLREEFAKLCFETMLQFSLLDGLSSEAGILATLDDESVAGKLAVTALLYRFQEVLRQYVLDEGRSGTCPLPRYRLSEISFVLKAIATLIVSLKKAPEKVNKSVWEQLISLYPFLVDCIATTSPQVSDSLRAALLQYRDLLKPPLARKD
ncbi:hypothetical protein M8J77_021836 [Diaphorina citri]|nr:hypothetical protein M8J77_021836 [Diaphorina citri]